MKKWASFVLQERTRRSIRTPRELPPEAGTIVGPSLRAQLWGQAREHNCIQSLSSRAKVSHTRLTAQPHLCLPRRNQKESLYLSSCTPGCPELSSTPSPSATEDDTPKSNNFWANHHTYLPKELSHHSLPSRRHRLNPLQPSIRSHSILNSTTHSQWSALDRCSALVAWASSEANQDLFVNPRLAFVCATTITHQACSKIMLLTSFPHTG